MYECMYVFVCVCVYVCMCMYVPMYVCMCIYISMYESMYVFECICMYVCIVPSTFLNRHELHFSQFFSICNRSNRTIYTLKMAVFWDIATCGMVNGYGRFGGACCPHNQNYLHAFGRQNLKSHAVSATLLTPLNARCLFLPPLFFLKNVSVKLNSSTSAVFYKTF